MTALWAPMTRRLVPLLLLTAMASAEAQETHRNPSRNIEIGAAISSVFPSPLGLGLRVTRAMGGRFSVEGGVDWTDARNTQRYADQKVWFFFWQVKQRLWSDEASGVFATYGSAGWFERQSVPPGRLRLLPVPPILPIVGISGHKVVAKYLAIRGDGQLVVWPSETGFAVPRISAGVSVPIRAYNRR